MITSESNRGQPSTAAPFERQTQVSSAPTEVSREQPQGEPRWSVPLRDPFWFMSLVVSGATVGAMWGLIAFVLAILGLSGVQPIYLLPVTAIVLGLAFLTLSVVDTAWARMFRFAEQEGSRHRIGFSSGVAAGLIAGLAAVVLGVLNLMFPGDPRFVAVAAIALGLGLVWHGRVMRRVSDFTYHVTYHGVEEHRPNGPFALNALSLAPVRDFVVGLGGAILGILAMLKIAPVILAFVALLVIGVALSSTISTICGATLATLKGACARGQADLRG